MTHLRRPISKGSLIVAAREQVSCDLGGEAAILNLQNGVYYGLNPVGARIWSLLREPRSVEEIRDILLEEYEVEPECCERDLLELLQALAAEDLVEVSDEAPAKVSAAPVR